MHREEKSGSPFVTPTFQGVLNHQLVKILDALDYGYLDAAYAMMKSLVACLNPTDSKQLFENHVSHIDKQIKESMRRTSMDDYQAKRTFHQKKNLILRRNLRPLFWRIMRTLHEGGYLEKQPLQPRSTKSGKLKVE